MGTGGTVYLLQGTEVGLTLVLAGPRLCSCLSLAGPGRVPYLASAPF